MHSLPVLRVQLLPRARPPNPPLAKLSVRKIEKKIAVESCDSVQFLGSGCGWCEYASPFPYVPVSENGLRGSCSDYKERRDITTEIKGLQWEEKTLDNIEAKYACTYNAVHRRVVCRCVGGLV